MIVNAPIPKHETMPDRTGIVRCHVIKEHTQEQCTAEAVHPDGELLICMRHLGLAMELVRNATRAKRRPA